MIMRRRTWWTGRLVVGVALPEREPPTLSDRELQSNFAHICGPRGYHGPEFANEELYRAHGGMWAKSGDCRTCWSTVNAEAEREKAQRAAQIEACYAEREAAKGNSNG